MAAQLGQFGQLLELYSRHQIQSHHPDGKQGIAILELTRRTSMFGLYGDLPQAKGKVAEADAPSSVWFPSKLKPALKRPLPSDSAPAEFKPVPRVQSNLGSHQSALHSPS